MKFEYDEELISKLTPSMLMEMSSSLAQSADESLALNKDEFLPILRELLLNSTDLAYTVGIVIQLAPELITASTARRYLLAMMVITQLLPILHDDSDVARGVVYALAEADDTIYQAAFEAAFENKEN